MNIQLTISIATLLLALAGFGFGIWVYWRQMNAQLFLALTARYRDVMKQFPEEVDGRQEAFSKPPPRTAKLTAAVVEYLNLCSEEFYLHDRHFLAHDIWSIWKEEMCQTLASELVRREWPVIRPAFDSYGDFRDFVDSCM